MKKTTLFFKIAAIFSALVSMCMIFCGCTENNNDTDGYCLLRLHIRADSNDEADQRVKLRVRDAVVARLEAALSGVDTLDAAMDKVSENLDEINALAERTLEENGFSYGARTRLCSEYFPARAYGDVIVEAGVYDALIIELGSGAGDNWWCVIYPPLCFVKAEATEGFKYRSLIKELWDKYVGKKEEKTEEKQCSKPTKGALICA